ncbi:hypothetical protein D3C71_1757240 [compost metagenome]
MLGLSLRIVELLFVEQGANGQMVHAVNGDGLLLGQIAGHGWQTRLRHGGEAVSVKEQAVWGFCGNASWAGAAARRDAALTEAGPVRAQWP